MHDRKGRLNYGRLSLTFFLDISLTFLCPSLSLSWHTALSYPCRQWAVNPHQNQTSCINKMVVGHGYCISITGTSVFSFRWFQDNAPEWRNLNTGNYHTFAAHVGFLALYCFLTRICWFLLHYGNSFDHFYITIRIETKLPNTFYCQVVGPVLVK